MTNSLNRRQLLRRGAAAAAGLALASRPETSRGFAANDTVQIGCIGTGGRCQQLMKALADVPGTRITAVCDIWDVHREAGKKLADPRAAIVKEYGALLTRQDVDAVIIGTPDHWHAPLTIAACAAGKDVYVEKPLTHEMSEGAAVVEAQNKHRRIVQVGTQQRSMPQFQQAKEMIAAGKLGDVHKVHLTWNRNTPRWRKEKLGIDPAGVDWKQFLGSARQQPFDEYRFRNWRWFWDFGGGIFTDLMVHQIDIANWLLGLDRPATAASVGDHYRAKDIWETPDTVQTLLDYPIEEVQRAAVVEDGVDVVNYVRGGVQVYFEGTFVNARNAAMLEFMGSDATLYLDRGRYELHPERNSKLKYEERIIGSGPRGADFFDQPQGEVLHLANWVDCIKSRKAPNAPAEAGVSAAAAAHLANMALRSGQVARWPG